MPSRWARSIPASAAGVLKIAMTMGMTDFLKDLNTRQREAVTATEGRIRVVAGAGTGKTKALTCRYAYLVNVLGIDPANILCLTFTNKAAAEMRRRISAMVMSGDYNDFVCTIDGFCVKLLRRDIYRVGFPKNFRILDEEDSKDVAKACMDTLGIKRTEKTVKDFLKTIHETKALNDYIDTYMLPTSDRSEGMLSSPVGCYMSAQLKDYALDFDDIENFAKYLLDNFPEVRAYWQEQLNYIMVDEAQDCNSDNWEIIEKLAAKHHNLFIVGDPDQCIYEWRGAKPDRFVNFAADKNIVLDENYRSTPNVLDVANSIISKNFNRIPKELFTRKPEGVKVLHFHAKTEKEEARWIVDKIRELSAKGADFSDFAVLYRSSYLSHPIEQEFISAEIPYVVWGGIRFFERKEVKNAIAYLKVIADSSDEISLRRVLNVPSRGLGKQFLSRLEDLSHTSGKSMYDCLSAPEIAKSKGAAEFAGIISRGKELSKELGVSDLMDRVLDMSGLKKLYREDQDEDRLENIDELVRSMRFYEESHKGIEVSLSDYLQDIALYTNADCKKDSNVVRLLTIHQSKGLEFPYVFIIGLSEGIFPSMRTIRDYKKRGEEEERRLMYVAVTRAERVAFLTESEGYNQSTHMNKYPSRFISEIPRQMFVTEGHVGQELWERSRNMRHVIDEERFNEKYTRSGNGLNGKEAGTAAGSGPSDSFADERAQYESQFRIGDKVVHPSFGKGEIIATSKDMSAFTVRFESGAERRIRESFLKPEDLP